MYMYAYMYLYIGVSAEGLFLPQDLALLAPCPVAETLGRLRPLSLLNVHQNVLS